ncbi:hypothetical protein ACNJQJ_23030, partial [Mycobacterium tuberculosis]
DGIVDPSNLFLDQRPTPVAGTAITVTLDGKRPHGVASNVVAAALRLLAQECDELGAYLVTESVPLTFPSLVESGSRTPGLAIGPAQERDVGQ